MVNCLKFPLSKKCHCKQDFTISLFIIIPPGSFYRSYFMCQRLFLIVYLKSTPRGSTISQGPCLMKQRSLVRISSPSWGHNLLMKKKKILNHVCFFFFLKVSNALRDRKDQHTVWWLEVLHQAEQNKDFSSELLRKIEEAISGKLNNSRSSRIASRLVMVLNLYITSLCHE